MTLGCNVLIWVAAWVQMACLKLAPSPASALWFERKLISSPSSWMLHWPCLVLVGALSAASAEMVGGQPHGGLSEAAWVGLLLLWWVCMECNKQHLSHSHTSASHHILDLFSWKKRKIGRKEISSQRPFRALHWQIADDLCYNKYIMAFEYISHNPILLLMEAVFVQLSGMVFPSLTWSIWLFMFNLSPRYP